MTASTDDLSRQASAIFQAGQFDEAERLSREAVARDPADYGATLRLGYIALLNNRLPEAQAWLSHALELRPGEPAPQSLLAEAFYRVDDFRRAAPLFRAIGRDAMARKLDSFGKAAPYQFDGRTTTAVRFVMTDPLPVISVRVNGGEPALFFIDTGAAEVIVDATLAREIDLPLFGAEAGVFAGGQAAELQHGRLESLGMGDLTVHNVPVNVMDVRRFAPTFGGVNVAGIVGTTWLYHFLSTLDYARGELVLRCNDAGSLAVFEQDASSAGRHVARIWVAGDHYVVGFGKINDSPPLLFFVDTGLVGGSFTGPESTLTEAGIALDHSQAREGLGGGGAVTEIPFNIETLSFAGVTARNTGGLWMGAFPIEYAFGFRIGGIISHSFFRSYALTLDFTGMRCFMVAGKDGHGSQHSY